MSTPSEVTVETLMRQAELLTPEERSQLLKRLETMLEEHRPPPGADIDAVNGFVGSGVVLKRCDKARL